jgi:hypothetical protein
MSGFVKLSWFETAMLAHALVSYMDNNISFKLSSNNVLYTFLDAYQTAYVLQNNISTIVNMDSFIAVSACLYYCIDDCLNLLNGVRSEHPFIKLNSINAEWLRETDGIREVLMEMQFLLRLNVFRQQISLLLRETFIMTSGVFAHIESIYLQCMPVIEGSSMPSSRIPHSLSDIPFIEGKGPLEGGAGILIRNENILPCYRSITFDYMLNTHQIFPTYASEWIKMREKFQQMLREKQPAKKEQKKDKSVSKQVPITGKVAHTDSELIALFDNPVLSIVNPPDKKIKGNTRKKTRSKTGEASAAANSGSGSGSGSDEFSRHVQAANDFSLNPEPFKETTINREHKYVFTSHDYQIISQKKMQIVAPLLGLFPSLFVKEKISTTGLYLNIFHKKPTGQIDTKKSIAHLSIHPINDLYHFKITAFRQFNLQPPPQNKDYTISFKMHRAQDSRELSATIQPFVNNVETEVVCPAQTTHLFRLILNNMVALLNANRGGVQTRRVPKNKNKRTKKRN